VTGIFHSSCKSNSCGCYTSSGVLLKARRFGDWVLHLQVESTKRDPNYRVYQEDLINFNKEFQNLRLAALPWLVHCKSAHLGIHFAVEGCSVSDGSTVTNFVTCIPCEFLQALRTSSEHCEISYCQSAKKEALFTEPTKRNRGSSKMEPQGTESVPASPLWCERAILFSWHFPIWLISVGFLRCVVYTTKQVNSMTLNNVWGLISEIISSNARCAPHYRPNTSFSRNHLNISKFGS
jgi:hypothetical protein